MDKSFAEFMAEFERKGKDFRAEMIAKRKRDAARKKLERGTPELPEREGRIYDSKNEQDREEANKKFEQMKQGISDIRQLNQYKK